MIKSLVHPYGIFIGGGGGGFIGVVPGSPSANTGVVVVVVSSTASAVHEIMDRQLTIIKTIKAVFFIF